MRLLPAFFLVLVVSAFSYGQQMPVFTAPAMDGTPVAMDKLKGKVVVINLWYINCPNCIEEIKLLNKLVDEYRANKDVVFIAPAASTKAQLESFLKKNPFNYTVLPNGQVLVLRFGKPDKSGSINIPFPMHIVYDRDGKEVVRVAGVKGVEAVRAELTKQFAKK